MVRVFAILLQEIRNTTFKSRKRGEGLNLEEKKNNGHVELF